MKLTKTVLISIGQKASAAQDTVERRLIQSRQEVGSQKSVLLELMMKNQSPKKKPRKRKSKVLYKLCPASSWQCMRSYFPNF